MSITRSLVEMMSGTISAESEVGVGTSFTVQLRQERVDDIVLGKEIAENLENFKLSDKNKRAKITHEYMPYGSVLIVDDVDANLFVAKGLMKPYGLALETVISGYDALEKVNNGNQYDIIFMDYMMPGMDGMETTKQIRETGYALPIIALTANAVIGQREIFLSNGFDGFISKPIDVRELDSVLKEWVRDKQPPEAVAQARRQNEERQNNEREQIHTNNGTDDTLINRLKSIEGLDVISALEYMCDSVEMYTDTVSLTARLLPETIALMDKYLETGDIAAFTIEVHGLKSVLKNIGAAALGSVAGVLENYGIDGGAEQCNELYPAFQKELVRLANNLKEAMAVQHENKTLLSDEADALLNEVIFALEAFDCESALVNIKKFREEHLNERS